MLSSNTKRRKKRIKVKGDLCPLEYIATEMELVSNYEET